MTLSLVFAQLNANTSGSRVIPPYTTQKRWITSIVIPPNSDKFSDWNTGVPKLAIRRIDQIFIYVYLVRRDCLKCALLCYTLGRWEFERFTRLCMEFKITKDKIARWNKLLLFWNEIKKRYSPCLVSVVHLAYFIVFWGFWGVCRSFLWLVCSVTQSKIRIITIQWIKPGIWDVIDDSYIKHLAKI